MLRPKTMQNEIWGVCRVQGGPNPTPGGPNLSILWNSLTRVKCKTLEEEAVNLQFGQLYADDSHEFKKKGFARYQ